MDGMGGWGLGVDWIRRMVERVSAKTWEGCLLEGVPRGVGLYRDGVRNALIFHTNFMSTACQ